jgi:sugar/nucleoside kinase (ribokinase family)
MYDVITIGTAVQDVFVASKALQVIKSNRFSTGMGECLSLGTKIAIDKLVFATGGGATNSAVTFSRAGLRTACICKVGDDIHGKNILSELKREKVHCRFVATDERHPTGYSVILTAGTGDRSILTFRSAGGELSKSDIPWKKLRTKWLYISSVGGNIQLPEKIIMFASKNKIKIAFNPGGSEIKNHGNTLFRLLPFIDVFILNTEEAAIMTGLPFEKKRAIIDEFSKHVSNIAVITDGKYGAYILTKEKTFFIHTTPKKVLNATGAGDAFGSGFVTGLILENNNMPYAMQLGLWNAESVVQHIGAKVGILKKFPKPPIRRSRITQQSLHQ